MPFKKKVGAKNINRTLHICRILKQSGITIDELLLTVFGRSPEQKKVILETLFPSFDKERLDYVMKLAHDKNICYRLLDHQKAYHRRKLQDLERFSPIN